MMQEWWNWQTHTFEGRMAIALRVQIPSSAPSKSYTLVYDFLFYLSIK